MNNVSSDWHECVYEYLQLVVPVCHAKRAAKHLSGCVHQGRTDTQVKSLKVEGASDPAAP